ncbi:YcaO-like family protein [Sphingomonas sp.]|uniref:YcaO-like family protein n=1 Tax=Sphingomonas sp. TaxID=28214 RepID=UPI002E3027B7|nr:YcaO-like family protein [Sphingomonas sp.]HEX4694651.1 YcaO-like family protein [Sphingomonas sp.]
MGKPLPGTNAWEEKQKLDVGLTAINDLLGPRSGVLRYLGEQPRQSELPNFHHFIAKSISTAPFAERANFEHSGGASVSRGGAMIKAVGEAVERYCAAIYDERAWPLVEARDAMFPHTPPASFVRYGSDQLDRPDFPFEQFDEDTRVRWQACRTIPGDREIYVPAAMIQLPYYFYAEDAEPAIVQPISTGLAAHTVLGAAIAGALCEVIERDAFAITWQAQLRHPLIEQASLPAPALDMVHRFEAVGSRVSLLWARMDHGVPTIIALQRHDHPDMPAITFAASTSPDPAMALSSALEELAHTLRWTYVLKQTRPPVSTANDYVAVVDQETHLRLHTEAAQHTLSDFIDSSPETVTFSNIARLDSATPDEGPRHVAAALARHGYTALMVEQTTPDVAELGFHVVRCVVPGLQPLVMGHALRFPPDQRLAVLAKTIPGCPRSERHAAPHPFP